VSHEQKRKGLPGAFVDCGWVGVVPGGDCEGVRMTGDELKMIELFYAQSARLKRWYYYQVVRQITLDIIRRRMFLRKFN
jgi:hypothetical protein